MTFVTPENSRFSESIASLPEGRRLDNNYSLHALFVLEPAGPFGAMATQNGPNLDYAGSCARKPPSLSVALNCGTGSSFLKALVKAFDKLHMVLAENSGYWELCTKPFLYLTESILGTMLPINRAFRCSSRESATCQFAECRWFISTSS